MTEPRRIQVTTISGAAAGVPETVVDGSFLVRGEVFLQRRRSNMPSIVDLLGRAQRT
jgi:hypothetical protein